MIGAFIAMLLAMAAAEPPMPGMLSIDDAAPVRVASAAAVRRALARCARPGGCASVMIETCDRCILSAEARGGGFVIRSRLGPPGPEYLLYDNRPMHEGNETFSAEELIEIFAGYISGPRPGYVGAVQAVEE
ncbi:MAG: hypothetical protein E6G92_08210 [Alphaproteobacteria bacterium]|nr:MAG: hypothetical protein E6G92_08210 [Alphaproteobacteria bacterium]